MNPFLTSYRIWITVSGGLETLLLKELVLKHVDAKVLRCKPGEGGIELRVNRENLWNVVCKSRIAESVRVRIGSFPAYNFSKLKTELNSIPWNAYLSDNLYLQTSVTCHESQLYHSGAVDERLKQIPIIDRLSNNTKGVPTKLFLRLYKNEAEVSLDCSGPFPLYKRGYRQYINETPMRETLAYSAWFWGQTLTNSSYLTMMKEKNYNQLNTSLLCQQKENIDIYDMCCGSGTLLTESMSDILNDYPVIQRKQYFKNYHYNFERWPTHNSKEFDIYYDKLFDEYNHSIRSLKDFPYHLYASDISKKAIEAMKQNIDTLNCNSKIIDINNYFTMSVNTTEQTKENLIHSIKKNIESNNNNKNHKIILLSNPPYGVKSSIDFKKSKNLYYNYFSLISYLKQHDLLQYACLFVPLQMTLPKSLLSSPNISAPIGQLEELEGNFGLKIFKQKIRNCGLDINLMLFK